MTHLRRVDYQALAPTFQTQIAIFTVCLFCSLSLVLGWNSGAAAAQPPAHNLSVVQYDFQSMQPQFDDEGILSEILRQETITYGPTDYLSKQTNLVLNDMLNGLARKIRVTFSPRVVIKPFFLVREVKDMLFLVQSRQLKRIQVDQNFQAKTALQPNQISTLQKLKKSKPFALSPYQNRLYGLHLNIRW